MENIIKVEWYEGERGLYGKSHLSHKIIFPQRGEEKKCCIKQGHTQKCVILRDTRPDEPWKGALIVSPGECEYCQEEKDILVQLGEGWSINPRGYLIAPDGVEGCATIGGHMRVENTLQAYKERVKTKEMKKALTVEHIAECATKPTPEGEPSLPSKPEWREPPKLMEVGTWCADQRYRGESVEAIPDTHGEILAVSNDGRVGIVRTTPEFSYISNDEMSMRTGGGGRYLSPLTPELLEMENHPEVKKLVVWLQKEVQTRDERYAEYRSQLKKYYQAHKDWWVWWKNLTVAEKITRSLQAEQQGLVCPVRRDSKGWKIKCIESGSGRKAKYICTSFPFTPGKNWDGKTVFQSRKPFPDSLYLEEILKAEDFEFDGMSVEDDRLLKDVN